MIESLIQIIEASRGWNAALLALFSIAVYVAASNFASSLARSTNTPLAEPLRRAGKQPAMYVLFELLRLGYYIGIPFVALQIGWIDLRVMGLNLRLLNWADGARWAIVIVLAAWLLLMVIWLPYLRATVDVLATPSTQSTFPRRMVELVYMQAHWAFYRAAAITFLQSTIPDAFYWGTALGLGLTALEAIAAPRVRERLSQIGAADGIVWNFSQAVLNALGFAVTGNLYLLVLIHFLLDLTVPHLRAHAPGRSALVIPPPLVPRASTLREQKTSES